MSAYSRATLGQLTEALSALEEDLQDRQRAERALEWDWQIGMQLVEHFDSLSYLVASDEDRRRLYQALRLRVIVDEYGAIRLSGIFDPDIRLVDVVQDRPRDPSKPLPRVSEDMEVVVSLDSSPSVAS